ncbi:GNAT family N-acetyltransferase [Umezawaea sp. Da 62-37]|uniref:GNAT family N-acetyltransferase n=1 Tax=Umezawaea sp. Da 62-37 TaxID=3075927 RepID=UPI0028F6D646|nr:GNAT family N-acetyltransferase [Umezawaea sp. Da 62-37]WNV88643.1 GNAT family N-acetyltransferase [Umezawaea sp. Da 62-37]
MIVVRVLGVDDWEVWRELRLSALGEAPDAFGAKLADWLGEGDVERRWRARLGGGTHNLVAYLDGRAAGMVSGTGPDRHGTVGLISMWVAPFARGRGVGDALVAAVVDWAEEHATGRVTLDVLRDNDRASALYRRHGFLDAGAAGEAERRMVRDP